MPNLKLSQLPVANNAVAGDYVYLVQGGVSKKLTASNLLVGLNMNIIPSTNDVYSMGNSTNRFRAIYVASDGIFLGNTNLRADANGSVTFSGNLAANAFVSLGSGVPTLRSNSNINLRANSNGGGGAVVITNSPLRFTGFTTTQRNSLIGVANGDVIYNTTTNKLQAYVNNSWTDLH